MLFRSKVVKNFENPKFSMENVNIMDDYFDETKQDSLQSRQCKARLEQAGIGTGSRFRVDRLCDFNDMEVKDIDLANGKMTFFHPTTHPDYQGEFERSIDRVLENIRMNQGSRWVQVDNDRKDIVIPAARQAVLDRAKDLSSHAAFSDSQVKSLERYCTLYSEKISKERILSSLVGDMGIVLREAGVSKDRIDDVLDELKQLAHDNRREKGKALENAWIFKRQDGDSYKTEQLLWVEKEKVLDWFGPAGLTSLIQASNPKLDSVTKILNNFENPKILDEKFESYDENLTITAQKDRKQDRITNFAVFGEEKTGMSISCRIDGRKMLSKKTLCGRHGGFQVRTQG